jgi:hypothetical protein
MVELPANAGVLAQLPEELHYLVEPALRYHCETEWDAFRRLDNLSERQLEELAGLAKRVLLHGHYSLVNKFLDRFEITDYKESAMLYFFFGLLDHAGLQFDRAPGSDA